MHGAEERRNAVLDASIAVRWLVPEVGSEEAAELLEQPIGWIAPRLLVTEVAATLRRKVRADIMRAEMAMHSLDELRQLLDEGILRLADDETLAAKALALALTTEHKVPDCLYLALAEGHGAALATADRALARLAERRKVEVYLVRSG
jgi:predicted nucleic acid-binding protein